MRHYELTVEPNVTEPGIPARELLIGELAEGITEPNRGVLFLGVYEGIVSLTDPVQTWNNKPEFRVWKLKKGTVVKLIAN